MPHNRRPTPSIPSALGYLLRPWWLPVLLFWVCTLGAGYLLWLFR
jgi:hypothetical protein